MSAQMGHLATLAERSMVGLHVLPATVDVPDVTGELGIATGSEGTTVSMPTLQDITSTEPKMVSKALVAWERRPGAAMPRPGLTNSHTIGGKVMEGASLNWRKSSYSGNGGQSCVEVASTDVVLVRDTTDRTGPVLAYSAAASAAVCRPGEAPRYRLTLSPSA